MEKINQGLSKITLTESSYSQAIRIIEAIGKMKFSTSDEVVVRIGCYVTPALLKKYAKEFGYNDHHVSSSITGLARLLPISKQNHLLIFNPSNSLDIYKLFVLIEKSYPMFELLLIKNSNHFDLSYFKHKKHPLFYEIYHLKKSGLELFFCGFDFDDPNFSSGFSKAFYCDFVPDDLKCYFS